jgi:hypothetical protein
MQLQTYVLQPPTVLSHMITFPVSPVATENRQKTLTRFVCPPASLCSFGYSLLLPDYYPSSCNSLRNNFTVISLHIIKYSYHLYAFYQLVKRTLHSVVYALIVEDARLNIEKASGSVTTGAYDLYDIVARELKNMFDRDLVTAEEAEYCVKTKHFFKVSGKKIDVSTLVQKVVSQVGQKITGIIKSKWSLEGEIDVVLLTGGGGALIQQHISSVANTRFLINEPQMANARGYYKRSIILERKIKG